MRKFFLSLCLSLLFAIPALAAQVTQVKGSKVMVDLQGAEVSPGDEFFLINPSSNKKVSVIRIKQVKGGRAVADVVQGHGAVGYSLQAKGSASTAKGAGAVAATKSAPHHEEAFKKNARPEDEAAAFDRARDMSYLRALKNSYGILGQYGMDSMKPTIKETNGINDPEQPDLKGVGLGAGGFYEWVLTRQITVRLLGVLEQFNVSGKTVSNVGCKGTKDCYANITYLSGYALAKYYFNQDRIRVWGGLGGGFLIAVAKSATALNESEIGTNQVLNLAIGADYQLDRKNYIPVSLEYIYFPPSATVTASAIVLKFGYAWQ